MRDRRAQGALFDAMAFLVIMTVASSALYAYSGSLARDARSAAAADEIEYARAMLAAWARSTVANASYELDGETVSLGAAPAYALAVEELAMIASGSGADFAALNARLGEIAETLSGSRDWSISVCSGSANFTMGAAPSESRYSASMELRMAGGLPGFATVVLSTWRS